MKLRDIKGSVDNLIDVRIGKKELDDLMRKGVEKGIIGGEQWFRKHRFWYGVPAYANPYKTPFEELPLLLRKEKVLKAHLAKSIKVYYGLGIGDTEIVPVTWDLELEKYSEIYAIDVIKDFIENFIQSLRNLIFSPQFNTSTIKFMGNNTMFERLAKDDFVFEETKHTSCTHICFGNTIGNFDQETIFSVFNRTVEPGDYLLLGYQLNQAKSAILKQYRGNFRFSRLISACFRDYPELKNKSLEWTYDEESDTVEAWMDNVLAFRSKKYTHRSLEKIAKIYGFEVVHRTLRPMHFRHRLVGISLMEKV